MSTTTPNKGGRPATGKTPQHQFRCPDHEWAMFEKAAAHEKQSVAVWLRGVAMRAAKRILKSPEE